MIFTSSDGFTCFVLKLIIIYHFFNPVREIVYDKTKEHPDQFLYFMRMVCALAFILSKSEMFLTKPPPLHLVKFLFYGTVCLALVYPILFYLKFGIY